MLTVFNLQWLRLLRKPLLALTFFVLTILFVFFILGTNGQQMITVQTFSDKLSPEELATWAERLNNTDIYYFEIQDRHTVEKQIQLSKISFALELEQTGYQFLVGQESQYLMPVNEHVMKTYRTKLQLDDVTNQFPDRHVVLKDYVTVDAHSLALDTVALDGRTNIVIGMTLYFSIYTILYGLANIAVEKRTGTWDRLISSPLSKTQIYMGQLLHYFLLGVLQIAICYGIFYLGFGFDFGTQYLAMLLIIMIYVFAVVALGMLILSLVKSPQQLGAVIPIVGTGMAMIGGAFWPLEIVSNRFMLLAARLTPIYYGMEALKGGVLYNKGVLDLIEPLAILLVMGIGLMVVGLSLMERKV